MLSPELLQYGLLGVGVWLSLSLLCFGFIVAQNLITQRVVLGTMSHYLRKQDEQLEELITINRQIASVSKYTLRTLGEMKHNRHGPARPHQRTTSHPRLVNDLNGYFAGH